MKLFKKILLSSIVSSLAMASGSMIEDSGTIISQNCQITNFSQLNLKTIADLKIKVGENLKCKIKADKNIVEVINFNVVDGELIIDSSKSFSTQSEIKITISTPSLKAIKSDGASEIKVSGLSEKNLKINLNGSGTLSGSGKVSNLNVKIDGSVEVDLGSLKVKNAVVMVKGASELKLFVSDKLDATAYESSEINYIGNPKSVKKNVTGVAEINSND